METHNEFYAIKGYEGLYEINKNGEVKSLERTARNGKPVKERILKQSLSGGYKQVCLSKEGKLQQFYIHQLIVIAFIDENYDRKTQEIDHINRDKSDNSISNLRIVSTRDNHNNLSNQSIYGVGAYVSGSKFLSIIKINDKQEYLGTFDTAEEANAKYLETKALIENIKTDFYFKKVKISKNNYEIKIFEK